MSFRLLLSCAVLALALSLPSGAGAQSAKAPQIGQPAPDFSLTDINGKTITLSDFKGKKNVMVVVHRGWVGYW